MQVSWLSLTLAAFIKQPTSAFSSLGNPIKCTGNPIYPNTPGSKFTLLKDATLINPSPFIKDFAYFPDAQGNVLVSVHYHVFQGDVMQIHLSVLNGLPTPVTEQYLVFPPGQSNSQPMLVFNFDLKPDTWDTQCIEIKRSFLNVNASAYLQYVNHT